MLPSPLSPDKYSKVLGNNSKLRLKTKTVKDKLGSLDKIASNIGYIDSVINDSELDELLENIKNIQTEIYNLNLKIKGLDRLFYSYSKNNRTRVLENLNKKLQVQLDSEISAKKKSYVLVESEQKKQVALHKARFNKFRDLHQENQIKADLYSYKVQRDADFFSSIKSTHKANYVKDQRANTQFNNIIYPKSYVFKEKERLAIETNMKSGLFKDVSKANLPEKELSLSSEDDSFYSDSSTDSSFQIETLKISSNSDSAKMSPIPKDDLKKSTVHNKVPFQSSFDNKTEFTLKNTGNHDLKTVRNIGEIKDVPNISINLGYLSSTKPSTSSAKEELNSTPASKEQHPREPQIYIMENEDYDS
ncbi:hypothetical protein BB560_006457 [Smittium megazygosporum]|uniref:Uncharacterized protein n=1 Tax=Smittium megazygosporum TaxID=133381 RepID=A0A2T9Y5M9_9FUNG|nr:hypothetical protein BB560_006457 [Smittium megazygosporum]